MSPKPKPDWRERIAVKQRSSIKILATLIQCLLNKGSAYTNYKVSVEDDDETLRVIAFNSDLDRRREITVKVSRFWEAPLSIEVGILRAEISHWVTPGSAEDR